MLIIVGFFAIVLFHPYEETNEGNKQLELENWDTHASGGYNVSDLIVQGTVIDIKRNYEIRGEYTYHVFPTVIYINITKVVWASESLMSEMGIRELPNATWNYRNTITIAYDRPYVLELSKGQVIESSGCYYRLAGSVYGGKLVIASGVEASYVKIL